MAVSGVSGGGAVVLATHDVELAAHIKLPRFDPKQQIVEARLG